MGRIIRGNRRAQVTIINEPDPFAVQVQSLGVATNTFSPQSKGTGDRGYSGDRGYGVNRFAGDTLPHIPLHAAQQPALTPSQYNLGIGAMVSGQPGLPNTGAESAGSALAWMSGIPQGLGA
jgi:hypothetical protein